MDCFNLRFDFSFLKLDCTEGIVSGVCFSLDNLERFEFLYIQRKIILR